MHSFAKVNKRVDKGEYATTYCSYVVQELCHKHVNVCTACSWVVDIISLQAAPVFTQHLRLMKLNYNLHDTIQGVG